MTPEKISVVIPTINEEGWIRGAVESARSAGAGEIIVVDGGSQDRTIDFAVQSGASKIVRALPGRGIQLNSGALLVRPDQEVILFLHADSLLGKDCLQQICDNPDALWGAFHQRINSPATTYRWIERGNATRVRVWRVPFGDQAIFVRKVVFDQVGGFDEIPLMEDVAFSKKVRRIARPELLQGPVLVSARRWDQRGPIRQTLQNWSIQIAYALGVSPQRLKQWYR
jgi:rSAM/selenodomain-associated transferase 2